MNYIHEQKLKEIFKMFDEQINFVFYKFEN